MDDLLTLIVEDPIVAAALAGFLVAAFVQAWKKLRGSPPGDAKWEKTAVALTASVLVAVAKKCLAGELTVVDAALTALVTWLTAAGVHSVALRSNENGKTRDTV